MKLSKRFIKWYIQRIPKERRSIRIVFTGKRLQIKQHRWLHFTSHPWEHDKKEE